MSSHPENAVNVYVKKHSSRQNGKRPSLRAQIGWMSRGISPVSCVWSCLVIAVVALYDGFYMGCHLLARNQA